jgi:hypothetical protein
MISAPLLEIASFLISGQQKGGSYAHQGKACRASNRKAEEFV